MDEFSRIGRIEAILGRPRGDVTVGIGDDAAVLAPSPCAQVLTVDTQVEGVHFRRDFASLAVLGRRAFTAAASDLAAMGARPRVALLSLILPASLGDDELFSLVSGVAAGADAIGATVVGGNLSAGSELSITHTVVGELEGDPLLRRGASPGDHVFVTGTPGARALGLAALLAGRADEPSFRPFVAAFLAPVARIAEGRRLRGRATAALDVSDGLAQDLGHLASASGVGAVLEAERLPFAPGFVEAASALGTSPLELALHGGEDYELLFTAKPDSDAARVGHRIGVVTEEPGLHLLEAGRARPLEARGYRHFDTRAGRDQAR